MENIVSKKKDFCS